MSQPVPSGRISGADGLRAFACLWVFFHHAGIAFDPQDLKWSTVFHDQGILGVAIFFVLSGMLLTLPFWRAVVGQRRWPDLAEYAKARLARVIPAYFVCVLACWAIFPVAPDRGLRILSAFTFTNWAHWRTFFPAPINAALWSIGIEVCFYVLLPLWAWGLQISKGRSGAILFWSVSQLIIFGIQVAVLPRLNLMGESVPSADPLQEYAHHLVPAKNPLGLFSHFLFGSAAAGCLALWPRKNSSENSAPRRFNQFDLLGLFCLILLASVIHPQMVPGPQWTAGVTRAQIWAMHYQWPLFPALTAALLVAMHHSKTLGRLFDNWLLSGVCKLSYGIYLWHMVVLELFTKACPWSLDALPRQIAASLVSLLITVLLAGISYRLIELPAMELLKRRPNTASPRPQLVKA